MAKATQPHPRGGGSCLFGSSSPKNNKYDATLNGSRGSNFICAYRTRDGRQASGASARNRSCRAVLSSLDPQLHDDAG